MSGTERLTTLRRLLLICFVLSFLKLRSKILTSSLLATYVELQV